MAQYKYRNLARIVIEAKTPLAVGSGTKDMITDQPVARDVNGLPYIPGAAIAGIIRHGIGEERAKSFFGRGETKKGAKDGHGSEIIFSSAQIIVDEDGTAVEGLIEAKSNYLENFDELPVRQHVRINEKGTAEKHGKFDEEVVYKGTRFCFEIELLSKTDDKTNFNAVLNELSKDTIRIGGGTRKGFGEIKIVECKCLNYDLSDSTDLSDYINKSSSLNDSLWEKADIKDKLKSNTEDWTEYKLILHTDDFFLFSSGFGDDEADMMPVTEKYIEWASGKPEFKDDIILIPGSSVKGALSHRVAFHYNKIKNVFVNQLNVAAIPELISKGYKIPEKFDSEKDMPKMIIEYNPAVRELFGYTSQDEKEQKRGNVLISDLLQSKDGEQSKILNHVSIDRFTGGAIDGALFSESVIYAKDKKYTLVLKVNNKAIEDADIKEAFEAALHDIANGFLPLGGGTNRGHGCFNGKILKNEKEI